LRFSPGVNCQSDHFVTCRSHLHRVNRHCPIQSQFRFSLNIDNDSLAFVTFSNNGRGLQLDYGACNFSVAGQPINFMSASSDQVLTPVEYARTEAHGLQKILEFAAPANLAMTRFVVRDRATGNIGLADVVFTVPEMSHLGDPNQAQASKVQAEKALANQKNADFGHASGYHSNGDDFLTATEQHDHEAEPLRDPVGSYGSVVPQQHAFCGDVFDLQPGIRNLPDFRDVDPVGSIYTSSLAVPYQDLPPETGIPGVTDRIAWFGVDYHATFWITVPAATNLSSCQTTAPDCKSMTSTSSTSMACTHRRRAKA